MFLIIAISHKRFLQSTPGELRYALWDMVASKFLQSFRLYGDQALEADFSWTSPSLILINTKLARPLNIS